jgi:2-haloacid dehalogenase
MALAAAAAASDFGVSSQRARVATIPKIRAVALEGLTTFDPRPVFALAEDLFPGKGAELGNAWRARQFEYTWLRTMTGHYVDFWHVTEDALVYAAKLVS